MEAARKSGGYVLKVIVMIQLSTEEQIGSLGVPIVQEEKLMTSNQLYFFISSFASESKPYSKTSSYTPPFPNISASIAKLKEL